MFGHLRFFFFEEDDFLSTLGDDVGDVAVVAAETVGADQLQARLPATDVLLLTEVDADQVGRLACTVMSFR